MLDREESLSYAEDEIFESGSPSLDFVIRERERFFLSLSFEREKKKHFGTSEISIESHSSRGNRSQFGSANRLIEERAVGTFNVSDGTQNRVTSSPSPLQ